MTTTQLKALKTEMAQLPRMANGNIQYTLEFKLKVIEAHKASGMTQTAFSKALGLKSYAVINDWSKVINKSTVETKSVSVSRIQQKGSTAQAAINLKRQELQHDINKLMAELDKLNDAYKLLKELGV